MAMMGRMSQGESIADHAPLLPEDEDLNLLSGRV